MNFRALEKSIRVVEKSWKIVSEKGYKPCVLHPTHQSPTYLFLASMMWTRGWTYSIPVETQGAIICGNCENFTWDIIEVELNMIFKAVV